MKPELWPDVKSAFEAALELPPSERSAFLDDRVGCGTETRAAVDRMLEAETDSTGYLEPPSPETLQAAGAVPSPLPSADLCGTRVGAYVIAEPLGCGGMGDVYRAERVDDQFHQEVAVKLVRSGLGDEIVRRFALERQVLARLEHPNIATLFDGGVTERGQPYLVMQYVRGSTITRHAADRGLSIGERLGLFRTVCDAVQFAHANLVVHRDLKPSNILVTDEGQVKLLDFGIAKLLDAEAAGVSVAMTEGYALLTPDHAAPEQLLEGTITTATDVYALGVLLYELLTGTRPHRATTRLELQRAICEAEPTRPSAVAREVPGDLDHIVLMALRKEPARRYSSAGQLGEDVARYLEGKPVIARPDTLGYRVRKFVGRNRLGVAAAAAVAVVLAGATIVTAHQSRQRLVALAEAQAERDEAEQIADFMIGIFDANDPARTRGEVVTARELLDRSAEKIRFELEEQPLLRADMEEAIARAYGALGFLDTARPLMEQALARRRANLSPEHPDVAAGLEQLARIRGSQGDYDEALELTAEALRIREAALGRDPDFARNLSLAGRLQIQLGRYDTARSTLERALDLLRTAGDGRALAQTLRSLGWVAMMTERNDEALARNEEALAAARAAVSGDHPFLFDFEESLALAFEGLGQLERAEEIHRRVLESRERVYGPDHVNLSFSLHNLGRVIGKQGRWQDALPLYQRGLEIRENGLRPDHPQVAILLHSYAIATAQAGDIEQGLKMFRRAAAIFTAELGADDEGVLLALEGLAQWLTVLGRHDEALSALETAVENGYSNLAKLQQRPFELVESDPRFQVLLERVRERQKE